MKKLHINSSTGGEHTADADGADTAGTIEYTDGI